MRKEYFKKVIISGPLDNMTAVRNFALALICGHPTGEDIVLPEPYDFDIYVDALEFVVKSPRQQHDATVAYLRRCYPQYKFTVTDITDTIKSELKDATP